MFFLTLRLKMCVLCMYGGVVCFFWKHVSSFIKRRKSRSGLANCNQLRSGATLSPIFFKNTFRVLSDNVLSGPKVAIISGETCYWGSWECVTRSAPHKKHAAKAAEPFCLYTSHFAAAPRPLNTRSELAVLGGSTRSHSCQFVNFVLFSVNVPLFFFHR